MKEKCCKCNGSGYFKKWFCKGVYLRIPCLYCGGEGEVDWIDNILEKRYSFKQNELYCLYNSSKLPIKLDLENYSEDLNPNSRFILSFKGLISYWKRKFSKEYFEEFKNEDLILYKRCQKIGDTGPKENYKKLLKKSKIC